MKTAKPFSFWMSLWALCTVLSLNAQYQTNYNLPKGTYMNPIFPGDNPDPQYCMRG